MSAPGPAADPPQPAARARRELALAVLLCLLGSALVLLAASRTWAQVRLIDAPPPLPATATIGVGGADLVPGVRALALVGLAGVLALLATRRTGRVAAGALLAVSGAVVVALVARVLSRLADAVAAAQPVTTAGGVVLADRPEATVWPWACLAGGLALVAAGAVAAVRGPRWAVMSRRYEPPPARARDPGPAVADTAAGDGERRLWEALDRGEDPT